MDPMGLSCKSCGVDYDEHLGLVGTCAELQKYKAVVDLILKIKPYDPNSGVKVRDGMWEAINVPIGAWDILRKLVDS